MFGIIAGVVGSIAGVASSIVGSISKLGLTLQGLSVLANVFLTLGKALGLIKNETEVEELGDKALQVEEQGITPEQFNTYEEYLRMVETFETDGEKSKKLTAEEKMNKGLEVVIGVALERFANIEHFPDIIVYAAENPTYFTENRMLELGKLMESDPIMAGNTFGFLLGNDKDMESRISGFETLKQIEKTIDSTLSDADIEDIVFDSRK